MGPGKGALGQSGDILGLCEGHLGGQVSFCVRWGILKAPLFATGERLVVGLVGSAWAGPKRVDHLARTVHGDVAHGANTQASTLLLNLHAVARGEGHLPEELVVNADNTPKETKNQICMWFFIWLLCALDGTPLWSIVVGFLLVGHTHNQLDRFFGRVSVALHGQSYHTVGEIAAAINAGVPAHGVTWAHTNAVWSWSE